MVNNADAVLNTYEELIAESTYFSASLQNERLSVISIPTACVPKIAWWLMREYGLKEKRSRLFHSLLMDNDGLSLCCNPSHLVVLESLLQKSDFTVSPQLWRPLIINVTGTASEFPGTVYFLASRLSSEGLSIFHISTFESEVFLIQDTDVVKATNILQSINIDDILGESGDRHVFDADQRSPVSSSTKTFPEEVVSEAEDQVNLDLSWIAPKENRKDLEDTFHLVVLPHAVVLAKLNNDFDLSTCSTLLISMLLYDERFSHLQRLESGDNPSQQQPRSRFFMWGMWSYDEELTILMEESDIDRFPRNALIVSPNKWRVIKLCGRPIAFDETGIVSSMSKIESNIPSLNISTATTNCTLVPDELLESTSASLARALKCKVHIAEDLVFN